jgi:hypothetical protein
MFTSRQYRAKAVEYSGLLKTANAPNEQREFQQLERNFTTLADDAQWLEDNHPGSRSPARIASSSTSSQLKDEHILRCLGAALIMQWNTVPKKLQRELFERAGAMDDLSEANTMRGQISKFLRKHN